MARRADVMVGDAAITIVSALAFLFEGGFLAVGFDVPLGVIDEEAAAILRGLNGPEHRLVPLGMRAVRRPFLMSTRVRRIAGDGNERPTLRGAVEVIVRASLLKLCVPFHLTQSSYHAYLRAPAMRDSQDWTRFCLETPRHRYL